MLVPGPEPAGPAARHVHPADHRVLAADVADQLDRAVEQDPPAVGVVAFAEQLDTRARSRTSARARDQLAELLVGQAVEDVERLELVEPHQIVAR